MKKILTLSVLFLVLFSGCKKEDPADNTPVDPFAANNALISSNAKLYLIADVEGLPGVTHINKQDTVWGITAQWSQGHCSNGDCSYGGGLGYISGNPSWVFKIQYDGTGETHEGLLVQNYTKYKTVADEPHGVTLWYIAENGRSYFSYMSDNPSLSWANIELLNLDATGQASTPTSTPYYIKLRFNCEMTCATDATEKIRFKNAVVRVKI